MYSPMIASCKATLEVETTTDWEPGRRMGREFFQQNAGGQIGIGFADPDACIAKDDIVLKQGVHHGVAEGDLFFPHSQPVLGQKRSEDPFYLPVGLLF